MTLVHNERGPMSKTELITTRVDHELAERIKTAAERDRRPVSQFVRNLLADATATAAATEHGQAA